ncbi:MULTISPECIES: hypothetical protein [Rhodococcus]|uniref:hypothetical protein n=1 Tax=Rhodococcus TaxID=1827 RepID=UPI0013598CD9|nr:MULTISPECIES: hypothetical protein [Rhodococcus]KAF0956768.1 hypothetical protein MLGJGCBP_10176 [Rhodococcus sp. T7]KAF0966575.1 hypothetical protein MLGJGCBP_00250 [Rhodococcus sp. T7]UOT08341.1 hypothetical protein MPY17_39265 [Rhodococcus opacus]
MSTISVRLDAQEQKALEFLTAHVAEASTQSDVVRAAIRSYAKEVGKRQLREEADRLASDSADLAEMQSVLADAEAARAQR